MICQMPKYNPLAAAARPKRCAAYSTIVTVVPYIDGPRPAPVCLTHACELAAWRLTEVFPSPSFTEEEKQKLLDVFGDRIKIEMPHLFI